MDLQLHVENANNVDALKVTITHSTVRKYEFTRTPIKKGHILVLIVNKKVTLLFYPKDLPTIVDDSLSKLFKAAHKPSSMVLIKHGFFNISCFYVGNHPELPTHKRLRRWLLSINKLQSYIDVTLHENRSDLPTVRDLDVRPSNFNDKLQHAKKDELLQLIRQDFIRTFGEVVT